MRTLPSRKLLGPFLASVSLALASCAHAPAAAPPLPSLASLIETEIANPPFDHALWGIRVEEEDGTLLYERNSGVLMMPASNRKVFVGAFSAGCLGLDATLDTELWIDGEVLGTVLSGNVVIKGGADPSLGGRYEADRDARLAPFIEALRARRIERVDGSVVADVSMFSRETIPGSWKTDNLGATYAAPVDAIAFNENVVGVQVRGSGCGELWAQTDPSFVPARARAACGAPPRFVLSSGAGNAVTVDGVTPPAEGVRIDDIIAITDPALYAAQALDELLERSGIEVRDAPAVSVIPRAWGEHLATIESPPLFHLLSTVLKNSQNLYAEMLFRAAAGGPEPISYAIAAEQEKRFLRDEAGLDPSQFSFADGSGLSVENMVTPATMVRIFRYLRRPERRSLFYDLLATPGEEGTLRRRLEGLEATFRGKTGTIDGVEALSGYLLRPDGSARYLSIMVNHHTADSDAPEVVIDRIVRLIAAN